ncbi:MAG: hypothetical protein ABF665_05515 [Gluconacetobacter sp.]
MITDAQLDTETAALKLRFLLFGSLRLLEEALETLHDRKTMTDLLDAAHATLSVAHASADALADMARTCGHAAQG